MAEKKLLLGDEQLPSERYMPAYRVYMPIRVHRPLKSQSLSRIILWQRKENCTALGVPMKKRPWRLHWVCHTQENVLWYV